MRTLLAAAAIAVAGMATAQAADIAAMTGHATKLNADSSALVYYVTAPDGFTLQDLVPYNAQHNEAHGEDNRNGSDRTQ
jgi:glycogen operon protein